MCRISCLVYYRVVTINLSQCQCQGQSSPLCCFIFIIYGHNDLYIMKLDIFQRPHYMKALKLSKSTQSVVIYGETGTTPLHITIEK